MNYIGRKCIECEKEFIDKDSIVVCPDCGTPYHRECYKENGRCINVALHESGESWLQKQDEIDKQNQPQVVKICPNCHQVNDLLVNNCKSCCMPLAMPRPLPSGVGDPSYTQETSRPLQEAERQGFGFDPNEDFDGARIEDIAYFVNRNTLYYIPLFKRMKDLGGKISFNIFCFLFPPLFFANRKMWRYALIAVVVAISLAIPSYFLNILENKGTFENMLASMSSITGKSPNMWLIDFIDSNKYTFSRIAAYCDIAGFAFRAVICTFADYLYYRFSIKSVIRLQKDPEYNDITRKSILSAAGGTSFRNILIIVGIYISFPALISIIITFLNRVS